MGRWANDEKGGPMAVLKDNNWVKKNKRLHLGPLKRKLFLDQLDKDVNVAICLSHLF